MLNFTPQAHVATDEDHYQSNYSSAHVVSSPEVDSKLLLQGQRELFIRHGNEYYRLRHTRNGKLILTK